MQILPLRHRRPTRSNTRFASRSFEAPAHFARQIDAALSLAPAEAFRGHTAALLCCGDPSDFERIEEVLRERWPVDAVHPIRCPIGSWQEALDESAGTATWLRHYVMREIHRHIPTLVVVLDRPESGAARDPEPLIELAALLRRWGATSPLAVLRVRADDEVEWFEVPGAPLEATG